MVGARHSLGSLVPLIVVLGALGFLAAGGQSRTSRPTTGDRSEPAKAAGSHRYTTETLRGRVVWLDEALATRVGVATEPAAAHTAVVLETPQGALIPLVPDVRGQAFVADGALRDIDLELLVRRYEGVPLAQVIRVRRQKSDGLYEIDYWCDVCAIPMFTLKPCECCQGPTRLRERKVDPQTGEPADRETPSS